MSTVSKLTANHLAGLREPGKRFELVRGELKVMSPAGGQHGRIAMRIGSMLEQHVRAHQLGQAFAAETGFLLSQNPDTVRAPDAAFVNAESYATLSEERGYLPIAPDLVVEVISPNDSSSEVEEKSHAWLDHGVRIVLVVDPANQNIRTYRDPHSIQVHSLNDILDASDVVDKWKFEVREIFA